MKLQATKNQSLTPKSYKLKVYPTMRRAISGFTLIESLVAITILIIGVLGPMMVATRGITDGLYAQNQLIGTHLAQEGLDLLSAQIENNNRAQDQFLSGLDPQCLDSSSCAVVVSTGASVDFDFRSCSSPGDCDIAFDDSAPGFYKRLVDCAGCNFVGPKFTRTLTVKSLTTTEVLLKSTVIWTNKSSPRSVILYRYAFDRNQ